jgi:hypothetical protein
MEPALSADRLFFAFSAKKARTDDPTTLIQRGFAQTNNYPLIIVKYILYEN